MIFDYETLKVIWWLFVGVLLVGFALMDGFDFGVALWLPFIGKNDDERRVILNSVGPVWEGNQTWLITAGGAVFAAWPLVYAASFSGFYVAMMVLLFSLFLRPTGFDYRSKVADPRWRATWDWCLFIAGLVPPLICGVAFGNLLQGVPFHYDETMRLEYTGNFFGLLNPFGLLCGVLSISMMAMQGGAYLQIKTEGALATRARLATSVAAVVMIVLFAIGGFWVAHGIEGYKVISIPDLNSAFVPTSKTVERVAGAWTENYQHWPLTKLLPILAFVGGVLCLIFTKLHKAMAAFLSSSLALACVILTTGFAMFPFVMPSSLNPNHSLTLWDSVSSQWTLTVMFWVVVVMLPIIIIYTSWIFRVLRGKVTTEQIQKNTHSLY